MGRYGQYGRVYGAAEDNSDSWLYPLTQLAASAYAESQDPVRQVAILTAQLENAYLRGASASEITLLKAKLSAAQQALSAQQATEASRWEWTNLGKIGSVVVIAVGLAVIYRVVRD